MQALICTMSVDMVVLTFDGNCSIKHRVPKEKGNDVVHYSIVFRTIKTKEGQGVVFKYNEQDNEDEKENEEEAEEEEAEEEIMPAIDRHKELVSQGFFLFI